MSRRNLRPIFHMHPQISVQTNAEEFLGYLNDVLVRFTAIKLELRKMALKHHWDAPGAKSDKISSIEDRLPEQAQHHCLGVGGDEMQRIPQI